MISVIVPTLNEADNIERLLAELDRETEQHEVIVVDGGGTDGTAEKARRAGAHVIEAAGGRGGQIAAGLKEARGDIFFMLHADCRFPKGGLAEIRSALEADAQAIGGNFRLIFNGGTAFSEWITEFYAGIRERGFYYGDSGIFVRRSVYEVIGGLKPLAVMEDYDFVRRMEAYGRTLCIKEPPLVTSIRRFRGRRRRWIVMGWLAIHALYYLGIPGRWLAGLYDSARRRERQGDPILGRRSRRKSAS